ncbi:MAG: tetratricopeptide repeat protein [Anaerolineae bacterium]|nr:tetratricopeptide repeat protein [Anaerolineae bacterium]MDQ7036889.1 tetratricopeptide repeat protein [Anaerolineae bacterium]
MTPPISQGKHLRSKRMTLLTRNRVAPLMALLVIFLGFMTFIIVNPSIAPNFAAVPTLNPQAVDFGLSSQIQDHKARGELQVALFHVEVQASLEGWTNDLHEEAGNLWRDMGDLSRAIPHWEVIAQNAPQPANLRRLAALSLQMGAWGRAYAYIEQLLQLAPNDEWGSYYGGLLLAPSDAYTARDYLSRATQSEVYGADADYILAVMGDDADDVLLSSRVGIILAAMGEWSLAENAFQYAASVNYPFPEATAYVGLMRVQQQLDGSSWIEQALALDPNDPDVHYIGGLYWRALENYDNAVNDFLTAIILDPTIPEYYAELGNTYRVSGNLAEAEYWLLTALNISDDNPLIEDALRRLREEETFVLNTSDLNFSRMARAENNDPAVIAANGWVLHILGQSEVGLEYVNRALDIDPLNPRAQYDKARILIEVGREDEAVPLLETLAGGDSPFATTAQRLLDGLN